MDNQMDYEINKELGECYLFMGDFDKAEDYYRKAAESNSTVAAPYMGLATVAVQRSELDKALVLYQKAAAVEASDKAYCGIGLVYMEQGAHTFKTMNLLQVQCFQRWKLVSTLFFILKKQGL